MSINKTVYRTSALLLILFFFTGCYTQFQSTNQFPLDDRYSDYYAWDGFEEGEEYTDGYASESYNKEVNSIMAQRELEESGVYYKDYETEQWYSQNYVDQTYWEGYDDGYYDGYDDAILEYDHYRNRYYYSPQVYIYPDQLTYNLHGPYNWRHRLWAYRSMGGFFHFNGMYVGAYFCNSIGYGYYGFGRWRALQGYYSHQAYWNGFYDGGIYAYNDYYKYVPVSKRSNAELYKKSYNGGELYTRTRGNSNSGTRVRNSGNSTRTRSRSITSSGRSRTAGSTSGTRVRSSSSKRSSSGSSVGRSRGSSSSSSRGNRKSGNQSKRSGNNDQGLSSSKYRSYSSTGSSVNRRNTENRVSTKRTYTIPSKRSYNSFITPKRNSFSSSTKRRVTVPNRIKTFSISKSSAQKRNIFQNRSSSRIKNVTTSKKSRSSSIKVRSSGSSRSSSSISRSKSSSSKSRSSRSSGSSSSKRKRGGNR
ncbi:MAG: hypothetical protein FH748_15545 [Balneolaceae bacterium]|nr:hypothetical protein [Balneolaceae bacterium]